MVCKLEMQNLKLLLLVHAVLASALLSAVEAPLSLSFHYWQHQSAGPLVGVIRFDENNQNRGTIVITLTNNQRKEFDRVRIDLKKRGEYSGVLKNELTQILRAYDAAAGTLTITATDSNIKKMRKLWERRDSHVFLHHEVIGDTQALGLAELDFDRNIMFGISFNFTRNRGNYGMNSHTVD
jgi:hypothetical protein